MTDPQTFTAPDGTEMVIITRARFDALVDAEEMLEDLEAAREGAASLAADGGIPFEVSNAIAAGKHPIAAWRKFRGLTQSDLADKANLTQAAITRLERAEPGAGRGETLDAIAAALDAPRWAIDAPVAAPAEQGWMMRDIAATAMTLSKLATSGPLLTVPCPAEASFVPARAVNTGLLKASFAHNTRATKMRKRKLAQPD